MTAQVLFFDVFPEKDPHLNAIERFLVSVLNVQHIEEINH